MDLPGCLWSAAARALGDDEVLVVSVDLDALADATPADEAEAVRAARLAVQHRHRWLASRMALRQVLGEVVAEDPQKLMFSVGPGGRPRLLTQVSHGVDFNLSHSQGLMLLAVAKNRRVGIDVECPDPSTRRRDHLGIAQRFFSPQESTALQQLSADEVPDVFRRLWTAKEAAVKALGLGFAATSTDFAVVLEPLHISQAAPACAALADLSLHALVVPGGAQAVSGGATATLAVAGGLATIRTPR